MPSFDGTCSVVSTVASRSKRANSIRVNQHKGSKVTVPGFGTITESATGDLRVDYNDGSILIVS